MRGWGALVRKWGAPLCIAVTASCVSANSGCVLRVASPSKCAEGGCGFEPSGLVCELAMFGRVSDALIAPLVIAGGDGMACGALDPSEVQGKAVVAMRGACPMSKKALNAEKAGAAAFICANSVPGDAPARMSYFGDEEALLSIPSVMVSFEDGERLRAAADETWAMGFAHTIHEGHQLRREFDLKEEIYQPASRETDVGERIMHLAEYFAQGNWTTESTVLVRQAAARSPENPELLYGVATYFWNFRKDAATARGYHEAAASAAALQVVDSSLPATAREAAMTVVKNVVVLIPEDQPQILVLRTFTAHSALTELKEILFFLHERRKMGSGAVLEWANRIEDVGEHAILLSVLAGFLREHPSREDDVWMSMMQEAKAKVLVACTEQTELDCDWFFLDPEEQDKTLPRDRPPKEPPKKKTRRRKIYAGEL